ncbi:MurR/RpiR family transcriptional regulator [Alkalicoccobacillus murimartini]|uniref:DNA-binding MurR/RpiR family transcriptional regulator n=1 Tax=Alkalicoccobacillus murimartini TaxID=171685 RepID=A0ABT9YLI4_9BACI|nr:MurR/RpiR family transcriptional regulator [Alkalicoccobacillus murimartini]MDQ0208703.1 DNA-binding MurR/RpiR family transcriptional regulator [Alkalicoccobacillus murimartini]
MRILDQLLERDRFTPNEKSIATFILSQKEKMLYLTIQELAKHTYTSHSAIIRLIHKIGMAGYKEFTIKLAQEIRDEHKRQNHVDPNYPFTQAEQPLEIAKELSDLMRHTIERTYTFMEDHLLDQTSQLINRAERIFVYALGDSQIRAKSFQNKMLKLNKYVVIATELSEWSYHSINLTEKDCAIFLSYHVKTDDFIKTANYLSSKGVPIVTITASSTNELTKQSTYTILVPNEEDKFSKIGTFASQISFEYVLNTIYSCIYKLDYENHKQFSIDTFRMVEEDM